jgi:hypothetical protein
MHKKWRKTSLDVLDLRVGRDCLTPSCRFVGVLSLMNSGPGWNLDWHSTKPPGVVPSSAEELIIPMFYCVHLIVL